MDKQLKSIQKTLHRHQILLFITIFLVIVFGYLTFLAVKQMVDNQRAYITGSYAANIQQGTPPAPTWLIPTISLPFETAFTCENQHEWAPFIRILIDDYVPCPTLPGPFPSPDPNECQYIKDTYYNMWLKFSQENCCHKPSTVPELTPVPTISLPEEMRWLNCTTYQQYLEMLKGLMIKSNSCPVPTGFPTLEPDKCLRFWDELFTLWLKFIEENCCKVTPTPETSPSANITQPCCGVLETRMSNQKGTYTYESCGYRCKPNSGWKYITANEVCKKLYGYTCGSITENQCQQYAQWACCFGSDLKPCPTQGISQ